MTDWNDTATIALLLVLLSFAVGTFGGATIMHLRHIDFQVDNCVEAMP